MKRRDPFISSSCSNIPSCQRNTKLMQSQSLLLHPRSMLWPWLSKMTKDFNCLWLMNSDKNSLKFLATHAVLRCGVLLHAVEEKTQNASLSNHLPNRTWPFVLTFSEQGIKLKTVSSFSFQSGSMETLSVVNEES